jgi:hypothetical protein
MRKLLVVSCFLLINAAAPPETIVSLYHPKPGKENELLAAIRETRAVYEKLDAVTGPHLLYRATDEMGGPSLFIQVFTWKSGDIPDHAPAEIKAAWSKLQSLVENRDGRPGIDFYAVEPVSGGSSLPAAVPSK